MAETLGHGFVVEICAADSGMGYFDEDIVGTDGFGCLAFLDGSGFGAGEDGEGYHFGGDVDLDLIVCLIDGLMI